jgi:hypothetical protein
MSCKKSCDKKFDCQCIPISGPVGPTGPVGQGTNVSAYVYNLSFQIIFNDTPFVFDTVGQLSNITLASSNITFLLGGVYSVIFYIQTGTESNNEFSLYVNGVKVGPTYAVFYVSPLPNTGYNILNINAGDVLTLVNTAGILNAAGDSLDGDGNPITNASLLITKLV